MTLTLVTDTDSVTETDSVSDCHCVCDVVVDGYPRASTASIWSV